MTRATTTLEGAPAPSLFEQPVVNIFAARAILRKHETPVRLTPALTIGNVVLAAMLEAAFEERPELAGATLRKLFGASRAAEESGDLEKIEIADAALQWVCAIRSGAKLPATAPRKSRRGKS
jgi:hypothetical protein